jgi:TPR repeat protein
MNDKILLIVSSPDTSGPTLKNRRPKCTRSLVARFRSRTACACFLVLALGIGLLVEPATGSGENNPAPDGSVEHYRKMAETGNVEAQYKLARRYEEGLGVSMDYKEAARWYLKAAKNGNAQAQHKLGIMYTLGKGVQKDHMEALKWFRKAARQGYEPLKQQIQEAGENLKNQLL